MFRSLKWYFRFIYSLVVNNGKLKQVDKLLEDGKNEEFETYVSGKVAEWAMERMNDSGAKVTVHGLENLPKDKKGMLFVSNHQSNFDILLLLSYLPVPKGFVAKIELQSFPFVNQWMRRIHCLFMDRSDIKQSAGVIVEGIKQLKSGINMVIFPEGTRSDDGVLMDFKAGSFKLATKSKCMLVPLTIDGTRNIMEANHYFIKNAEVNLYIHEPIDTSVLTKEECAQLPDKVRGIIESDLSYKKQSGS